MNWCGHCHCESCRRNCSAGMTTFIGVNDTQWAWTGKMPAVYASSKGVERMFCKDCGTPMAYRNERFGFETHFYLASLDNPEDFKPDQQFHHDEKLSWMPDPDVPKHQLTGP